MGQKTRQLHNLLNLYLIINSMIYCLQDLAGITRSNYQICFRGKTTSQKTISVRNDSSSFIERSGGYAYESPRDQFVSDEQIVEPKQNVSHNSSPSNKNRKLRKQHSVILPLIFSLSQTQACRLTYIVLKFYLFLTWLSHIFMDIHFGMTVLHFPCNPQTSAGLFQSKIHGSATNRIVTQHDASVCCAV